ncbi:hypothetical protein HYT24_03455 [Candidatus Pacearchaeota archaeon]|nr:hypothetical protein [Candidatus Pacearchaeota archaeon]
MIATRQNTDMRSQHKRGMSEIIVTMLMISLVMGLAVVIWGVSRSLINEEIEGAQSCFGNFGGVQISKQYTCINSTANEIKVSISVGDIDSVDGVLVSVSGDSGAKSFTITNGSTFSYVKPFGGSYGGSLSVPGKNSALTYVIHRTNMGVSDADSITIAPIISSNQCEASDSLQGIDDCLLSA